MATVNPYINFNGNCKEAFDFYKSIFGGEYTYIGYFKEMPPEHKVSPKDENKVMHVSLPISKETNLMGSDMLEGYGEGFKGGNNFQVSITASSEMEATKLFNELSAGGKVTMPLEKAFWGSLFGMFVDKFGVNWMVSQQGE